MKRTIGLVALFFSLSVTAQHRPLQLWFDKPAAQWEETLPLGNGRLGMTPDGGVEKEKIVLNDITALVWQPTGRQQLRSIQATACYQETVVGREE